MSDTLRLDRLVLEAAALDDTERLAFLARLRDDDSATAERVARCLRAAEDLDDDFLASPASEMLAALLDDPEPGDEEPPESDERYEIGDCLGEGGMARVYHAFDRQLGRPVALKILRTRDPETPRRLLREARAQARVRHDHVLDVYETGELGGRPYVAVRYAAGGTLAEASGLPLEQKVRLVAQAAEGLHAAHREGLLHGDVKPSNVLVERTPDGDLRAWIGDFGIAVELTEEGERTALAGTPRFMAPELRRRERADRRADVYSLGVTLFQVLTGRPPPIDVGRGWAGLHDAAPGLPPDLTAVIARCLADDPADRYPSARAVAEDLRRFLDGDVVEAYADRRAYRWARFAARHRRLLAVAGVSAVLLVAALLVAAVMGVRAVRANAVADQRRAQAEGLIDFMLLDLREKLEPVGRLGLLDDVGERAMAYFAAVPESELSDEELSRRSTALHQIAQVRIRRGDLEGAERPLDESLALARALVARHPDDPDRLFDLGQSEFWAGYARWRRGDPEAARRHFEAYAKISQRLVALDPERPDWQAELSYAHSNLGSVLEDQGDLESALDRFHRTLAIDRRLVAEAPRAEADQRRFDMALTHNTIGVVLERMGRLDEALVHYRADLDIRRRLDRRDPSNRQWREFLGTSLQYLGALHLVRGELEPAGRHLEASRDLFEELTVHDPSNGDWSYKLAWAELRVGRLAFVEGDDAAAREAWERSSALARELGPDDAERFDWRHLKGVVRHHEAVGDLARGRVAAARETALRAVAALEPLTREKPDDQRVRRWLAESLILLGDAERAAGEEASARRRWEAARASLAPRVDRKTRDHRLLVPWERVHRRLGHGDEADRARALLAAAGIEEPSRALY